jgi:hypothetical protein
VASSPSARPQSRARRAIFALVALGFGATIAFALGEGVFRYLRIQPQNPGRLYRISDGGPLSFPGRGGHRTIDLYTSNPRGTFPIDLNQAATRERLAREGFRKIDEARVTNPFGVLFDYNKQGFRDREIVPKRSGVKRVVFVGDSFTEGMGVVEKATAPRIVESLLYADDSKIEVFNLGVRALDFPELESLFEKALEFEPDAVVFSMVLNDGDRSQEMTRRWPRVNDWIMVRQDAPSWIERHSRFAAFIGHRYELMRVTWDTTAWYRALYSDENRDGWMRTRAALRRAKVVIEARGGRLGVALWPLLVGLETEDAYPFAAAHAQIQRGVERTGLPFVDLWPVLRGRRSENLWVHPSDLHPNEVAQTLAAGKLAELARLLLRSTPNSGSVAK